MGIARVYGSVVAWGFIMRARVGYELHDVQIRLFKYSDREEEVYDRVFSMWGVVFWCFGFRHSWMSRSQRLG